MGDGLEPGRTEITSCYHQGLREGGGWTLVSRWDLPKHNASLTNNTAVFCCAKAVVACN